MDHDMTAAPHGASRPEVVLFDVGGVLVQLGGLDRMLAWTENRYTEAELWQKWLRFPEGREFECGRLGVDAFIVAMIREFGLPLTPAELRREFSEWHRSVFPGARALVRELQGRVKVAALSNTNILQWEFLDREFGLGRWFDATFLSHELGLLKPDAAIFHRVIGILGVPADRILFFDDAAANIAAARTVGLRAEQVRNPGEARAALVATGVLDVKPEGPAQVAAGLLRMISSQS